MSKKKIFTKQELENLSAEEIIDKIQHENYSLLATLGAEKLRKEMVPVGKICNTAVNYWLGSYKNKKRTKKGDLAAQRKMLRTLAKLTPVSYNNLPKDIKNGLVIGFNHPSLGEIPRLALMKVDKYGDAPMYFPVNLPWYEALAPNYERACRLGIIITPTITPATWKKIGLTEDDPLFKSAVRIKKDFRNIYTRLSHDGVRNGGVIFVAPSATRQATVFKNKKVYGMEEEIIPTMSMLALKLYTDPKMKCDFLPIAVLPPKNYKRGLNFFKEYELIPGEKMTAEEIRKKYFKGKKPKRLEGFDYDFHKRIAEKLPKEFWN